MKSKNIIFLKIANKGYILLEYLVSVFIFLILLLLLNKYINFFYYNDKNNVNEIKYSEIKYYFLYKFEKDIRLRDYDEKDILIYDKKILFKKNNNIVKYEYINKKLYVSALENTKISLIDSVKISNLNFNKRNIIIKCDNVKFEYINNMLIIFITKNNKIIVKKIKL